MIPMSRYSSEFEPNEHVSCPFQPAVEFAVVGPARVLVEEHPHNILNLKSVMLVRPYWSENGPSETSRAAITLVMWSWSVHSSSACSTNASTATSVCRVGIANADAAPDCEYRLVVVSLR